MTVKTPPSADQVLSLYQSYADGTVGRREFMRRASALGIAGVAASALGPLAANPSAATALAQAAAVSTAKTLPLDLAEWSFMWVNVKRADTARGSFIGGQQMDVEHMLPTRVRRPAAPTAPIRTGGTIRSGLAPACRAHLKWPSSSLLRAAATS